MNGIRIIDCTRVLAGPWATQQLADQGADVIKVESPTGDETRGYGPMVAGESTYFQALNRNKRSACIDLTTAQGQHILDTLLASADVLVDNVRTRAAAKLGLLPDRIRATHPHIVHVGVRGFGAQSPEEWRDRPGYDVVIQALSGGMSLTGMPDGPPVRSALPVADLIAGLLVTQAVLLGLLQRQTTGTGTHTAVDMMQANTASLVYHATRQTLAGDAGGRLGNAHAGLVPYDAYPCSDGWMAIGCGNDRIWKRLVDALGLASNASLDVNAQRVAQRSTVDALVSEAVAHRTMAQCDALFAAHGVPAAPVQSVAQAIHHPAVNNVVIDGRELPGVMLDTQTTRQEHTAAPRLGSDTESVLSECGYSADDVERLRATGVVK